MKRMLVVMMAFALVLSMSMTAAAKDTVQITLTSPAIVKVGCEKAGAVTFQFDANSEITTGDWWYFDLPENVTLCKSIDYFIVTGVAAEEDADFVTILDDNARTVALSGAAAGLPSPFAAGDEDGPLSVTNLGLGAQPSQYSTAGELVLRVVGKNGSQRVWVYVYGTAQGVTYVVGSGTTFNISILDGQPYQNNILLNTGDEDADVVIFGEDEDDTIDTATATVPHVENALCIDATEYSGSQVYISLDSLDSKFTFTGDSQIAHVASDNPITLELCPKSSRAEYGDIPIEDQESCFFDYEDATGYCTDTLFIGNRIYLVGQSTFGDPDDRYDINISLDTPGVYFFNNPVVTGIEPDTTKDCDATGDFLGLGWVRENEAGDEDAGTPETDCSVDSDDRVRIVKTVGGEITSIHTYDGLWIDLPSMAYDSTIVGPGVEVEVTITLSQYPCGVIFTGTQMIGTFVDECAVAEITTLLFPFLPPLDGSIPGWWGGFVIVNASDEAGTAELTLTEEDGDVATYTTDSIAAGTMWNSGAPATLLGMVTPAADNAGTFGDANVNIVVECAFGLGGGFGFTGNGTEGVGYSAYVLDEAGVDVTAWE